MDGRAEVRLTHDEPAGRRKRISLLRQGKRALKPVQAGVSVFARDQGSCTEMPTSRSRRSPESSGCHGVVPARPATAKARPAGSMNTVRCSGLRRSAGAPPPAWRARECGSSGPAVGRRCWWGDGLSTVRSDLIAGSRVSLLSTHYNVISVLPEILEVTPAPSPLSPCLPSPATMLRPMPGGGAAPSGLASRRTGRLEAVKQVPDARYPDPGLGPARSLGRHWSQKSGARLLLSCRYASRPIVARHAPPSNAL